MEKFILDTDQISLRADQIPARLYRVQYDDSATIYQHPHKSLMTHNSAGYHVGSIIGCHNFKHAMKRHLSWNKTNRSIFVSLFSERDHAVKWMRRMNWNHKGGGNFRLLEIDTSHIGTFVFKASELVETLGLDIPDRARECVSNEYLVTYKIPCHAIKEIPQGMDFSISLSPALYMQKWASRLIIFVYRWQRESYGARKPCRAGVAQ